MPTYRVQIVGPDGQITEEMKLDERDPDAAAVAAVGQPVTRGAKGVRKVLCAKVYWQDGGTPTMARFYHELNNPLGVS